MVTGMVTEEAHVVLQVILLVRRVELLLSTSQLSGVLVVLPGPLAVEVAAALLVLELPWSEEATLQQVGAPNRSSDPMRAWGAVLSVDV